MSEPEPTKPLRLFVAVHLTDQVRTRISEARQGLCRALPEGAVRWAKSEQFHLTLRFLGDVQATSVPLLIAALGGACHGFAPLQLRAAGIGFFPRPQAPRVVWIGVQDSRGQLPALHRAIQEATNDFTAEAGETRFAGHVTLGRVKSIRRSEAESLARTAAGLADRVFGDWIAGEVHLMRSELRPQGAAHSVLAALPLEGVS